MNHRLGEIFALASASFLLGLSACGGGLISDEVEPEPWVEDDGLRRTWRRGFEKLDVLFVIDNSRSMSGEQELLARELRQIAETLVLRAEGEPGLHSIPTEDVHFGVVTSDVGSGGYPVTTCSTSDEDEGDGGRLQSGTITGCGSDLDLATDCPSGDCPWSWHLNGLSRDGCSQADFSTFDELECLASVGSEGCGFGQPIEAAIRALTTHSEPGGVNEGFLRPDARLLIIFIADGDDCSAADHELYDPEREDLGPLNERCQRNPDLLRSVEEYAEILSSLAPERTRWVDVAVIGGFPMMDDSWLESSDPAGALADIVDVGNSLSGESLPICEVHSVSAYAPIRLIQLAQLVSWDPRAIASICGENWSTLTSGLFSSILPGLEWCPPCPMGSGDLPESCHFVETLPDDGPCPHLVEGSEDRSCGPGWHRDLGLDEEGRRRCEILPSDCDIASGATSDCIRTWRSYDSEMGCVFGSIYFESDVEALMSPRSTLRLECSDAPCQEWVDAWEEWEEQWD